MKKGRVVFTLIGSGFLCLVLAGASQAQIPQVFVSSHGSDKNPCTTDKPCQTFNQALTVVQPGGAILVQDSGDYSNGFAINKSVTIDAGGFSASVTSTTPTDLCTINTSASDSVVLRGISFHGAKVGNNAINVTQVGSLYVERCSITGFLHSGVNMESGGNLSVTGTDVRECVGAAISLEVQGGLVPANLVVQDSLFTLCFSGVTLQSGQNSAVGLVTNCTASLCAFGFIAGQVTGGKTDITLTNCRAVSNANGFLVEGGTIRIANCVITGNGTAILSFEGQVIGTSPGTNLIAGNRVDGSVTSAATLQ
jgi:hypothetical protein